MIPSNKPQRRSPRGWSPGPRTEGPAAAGNVFWPCHSFLTPGVLRAFSSLACSVGGGVLSLQKGAPVAPGTAANPPRGGRGRTGPPGNLPGPAPEGRLMGCSFCQICHNDAGLGKQPTASAPPLPGLPVCRRNGPNSRHRGWVGTESRRRLSSNFPQAS